ncbi:MAG: hypothetical protein ABIB61_01125 [Candidatus Shapirobacteria bacterium]
MFTAEYDFLRTRLEDLNFHSSRIMFWVVEGEIVIAPPGTSLSHLEMAETGGWINEVETENFFKRNMRGFFLRTEEEGRIHFYRGLGFGFDEGMIVEAKKMLPVFVQKLGLSSDTKVYFGPKDSLINGVEYPIQYGGTVEEVLREEQAGTSSAAPNE